jgi:hypothetical protein
VKDRHRIFVRTYWLAWAILLAAFVTIGGRDVWIGPSEASFVRNTPFASTDAYFEAFFQVRDGSQRCLEIMRRLYGKGTIAFFCPPHDARSSLGFGMVSYLSWPQQIRKVEVEGTGLEAAVRSLNQASTPAIIFCNVKPPAEFARGWRMGPRMFIAPLDQAK